MKIGTKNISVGQAAFAAMIITALGCAGGGPVKTPDGGTDRMLVRNYFAVNAGYSGEDQSFTVAGQQVAFDKNSDGTSTYSVPHGAMTLSKATLENKQLEPIPYVVKNPATDSTLRNSQQQVTSSDRHAVVTYGPDSALEAYIIPFEPIDTNKIVFDVALLDSSETRTLDLYLLGAGETLASAVPVFKTLKYDPGTPLFMVQQAIRPTGGVYTLKVTETGKKTEIPEYTKPITLKDKFFNLLIYTQKAGKRSSFMIEQKRAPG